MVARIWRGHTSADNADKYESFLQNDFMPSIAKKNIPGYRKFQLLRKQGTNEVAFITIMWFDDVEQVKGFAGEDFEKAVIHPTAAGLLQRYDEFSQHFELEFELNYD